MDYKASIINLDSYKRVGHNTIKSRLYNLKKRGKLAHIRKGVYLPAGITGKWEIACNSVEGGCLSFHSALEYYSLHTQAFTCTYVHSLKPFRTFEYMNEAYLYKPLKFIFRPVTDNPNREYPVKVTSLDQTVIDCLFNIGLAGGLEELLFALADLPAASYKLDEDVLAECLDLYGNKSLYQRAGFVLSHFEGLSLSGDFFRHCKEKMGKNVSHLLNPYYDAVFFPEWNIYAPQDIMSEISKGIRL